MSTRKTTWFYAALISVASLAIGMVIASRLDMAPASMAQPMAAPPMNSAPIAGALDAQTFRTIARSQSPMVVSIATTASKRTEEVSDYFGGDDFLRRFFGNPNAPNGGGQGQEQPQAPRRREPEETFGAGTGFIIDKSGLILTNNHVVENATKITVNLFGDDEEREFSARVVGRDPLTDSALIELVDKPSRPLQEARFGDSEQMQPGDWVMAIGNPFGYDHTVTVGVVSGLSRQFPVAPQRSVYMMQTDAAINPGNSGGPLLNVRGEVVGINTAILSNRMANIGIGFAVPINGIRELLPQLRTGKITRGMIGVSISTTRITSEIAETLGLSDRKGAIVSSVSANTPAGKAGIRPGDVIVEFNGRKVENDRGLVDMVVATRPGTTIPVKIVREKQPKTVNVTVGELNLDQEAETPDEEAEDLSQGFGLTLEDVTPALARRLRLPAGTTGAVVVAVRPRGPADRASLREGDVIVRVGRNDVADADAAASELQRVQAGRAVGIHLLRAGQEVFVTMRKD
jgi:serine protease Do